MPYVTIKELEELYRDRKILEQYIADHNIKNKIEFAKSGSQFKLHGMVELDDEGLLVPLPSGIIKIEIAKRSEKVSDKIRQLWKHNISENVPDCLLFLKSIPKMVMRYTECKEFELPGLYFLIEKSKLQYIGETENFVRRIKNHTKEATKKFDAVYIFPTNIQPWKRKEIETAYIRKHQPPLNKRKK